jgi:RNA polymerase sigma factor (sigma-70 family)
MNREHQADRERRFEELYRSTAKHLLAFIARRTTEPEEATDLLAETYTVAWRRLDEIPPGTQATLWLFGVARNLLMKNAHQHRSQQNLVHDLTQELARLAAYRPETTDDGLTDKMQACLKRLPAKQREILLLTAWEGLKPREIAKITGSTANIVRVRLHHARQRLAQELRPARTTSGDRDDPASERLANAPTAT